MLDNMATRGPDSAGFAIYTKENKNNFKYSICLNNLSEQDFRKKISKYFKKIKLIRYSDHIIMETKDKPQEVIKVINEKIKEVSIVGYGKSINIFKQTGNPKDVVRLCDKHQCNWLHVMVNGRQIDQDEASLLTKQIVLDNLDAKLF